MRRFQNILYVSRGTAGETVSATQALGLARDNGARLHALIVVPMLPDGLAEYEDSLSDRARASLASAHAALRLSPEETNVTTEVQFGRLQATRIVRRVLRNSHDLIVKQAGRADVGTGFRELDIQLMRLCPCPVWLCRPPNLLPADSSIAVAVNPHGASAAEHALALQLVRLSHSLAEDRDAELHVISCWDYDLENYLRKTPSVDLEPEAIDELVLATERASRDSLDTLIRESGIDGRIRIHHARGRPDHAIPRIVNELQSDTLVMGTVARTGLSGFVLGNTAENVLREVGCSLLVMKPEGFKSPVRAF